MSRCAVSGSTTDACPLGIGEDRDTTTKGLDHDLKRFGYRLSQATKLTVVDIEACGGSSSKPAVATHDLLSDER